jgi:hypothetical protein
VVWDNPNLRHGEPGYLLEEGDPGYVELQPGEPGYVAPETEPKRKRHRRALSQTISTTPNPTTSMDSHFHFNVVPIPGTNRVSTRVVHQEDLLTPELVASAKAALDARGITLTPEQITAVGEELSKVRIAALAQGRVVRRAFGYFTDESTCGGSHDDPDFTPTVDNMNAGVRSRLAPDGLAYFDSLVTFQRDGVLGGKTPVVTRVYDGAARDTDRITLGGPFRLSGPDAFGPEPPAGASDLGIFLERDGGTPVRIGMFSKWTNSEIYGSWPAAISGTGDVRLSIVVRYGGNTDPSEFVYTTDLPIVP